jgi:curved DNA-binding protein CbpA
MISYASSSNDKGYPDDDLYEILQVSEDAEMSEIKDSFKRLALKHHPDKSRDPNSTEEFKKIKLAYEILSSYRKRREYDDHRSQRDRFFSLPMVFSPFFSHFNPFSRFFDRDFGQELDRLFERAVSGPGLVQTSSYRRGPDGRSVVQHRVRTSLDGKPQEYHHRVVKDQKGNVLEEEGTPIPVRAIRDQWIQRQLPDRRPPDNVDSLTSERERESQSEQWSSTSERESEFQSEQWSSTSESESESQSEQWSLTSDENTL